jgi:ferric-dicitrate binding protein FerR (iron transport regulator)
MPIRHPINKPMRQPSQPPAPTRPRRRLRNGAWALVTVTACLLVFLQYLRPDMTVDLANRLWSCF